MNARVFLPLVCALGLVLAWALFSREERNGVPAVEGSAEAEILARLARIEAALEERGDLGLAAAPAPSALAFPSTVEERRAEVASTAAVPAVDLTRLEAEVAALARAVEGFQQVARSSETPAKFPSLELLRSAPEANWEQLGVLVERQRSGHHAENNEGVHWMSQEELLAMYGRPNTITEEGDWHYEKPGAPEAGRKPILVKFGFISDYVQWVAVDNAW